MLRIMNLDNVSGLSGLWISVNNRYFCITKKVVTRKAAIWRTRSSSVQIAIPIIPSNWQPTCGRQVLQKDDYAIYSDRYELEDPFFRQWILAQTQ